MIAQHQVIVFPFFLILYSTVIAFCALLSHEQYVQLSKAHLAPPKTPYAIHPYAFLVSELKKLAREYPDLLYITSGQELYGSRLPPGSLTHPNFTCLPNEKCETLIVRLASPQAIQDASTPEVFLSGCFHGDERLGPNVLLEFLRTVCHMYGSHPIVTYLIDTRAIWITPITNAWGYAHKRREELSVDPNRDFPYLPQDGRCFKTIAGRVVNELFRDHLFQLAITFHAGTRLIAYEWGSFDHARPKNALKSNMRMYESPESPDQVSQRHLAECLQKAAGALSPKHTFGRWEDHHYRRQLQKQLEHTELPFNASSWYYPIGSMNEYVYPVNGGFEDWSYAGSWHGNPPISKCHNTADFPLSRSQYLGNEGLRCSTFLVETGYRKTPHTAQLGNWTQVISQTLEDGELSRNVRVTFKLIELVKPDLIVLEPPAVTWTSRNTLQITAQLIPVGCRTIAYLNLVLTSPGLPCEKLSSDSILTLERSVSLFNQTRSCRGIGVWEHWDTMALLLSGSEKKKAWPESLFPNDEQIIRVNVSIPMDSLAAAISRCAFFEAAFDQDWGHQNAPEPPVKPQTHIVRSRHEKTYDAKANLSKIHATKNKLFIHNSNSKPSSTSDYSARAFVIPPYAAPPPPLWRCVPKPLSSISSVTCPCASSNVASGVIGFHAVSSNCLVIKFLPRTHNIIKPSAEQEAPSSACAVDVGYVAIEALSSSEKAQFALSDDATELVFRGFLNTTVYQAEDWQADDTTHRKHQAGVWVFSPNHDVSSRPDTFSDTMLKETLRRTHQALLHSSSHFVLETDPFALLCHKINSASSAVINSYDLLLQLYPSKTTEKGYLATFRVQQSYGIDLDRKLNPSSPLNKSFSTLKTTFTRIQSEQDWRNFLYRQSLVPLNSTTATNVVCVFSSLKSSFTNNKHFSFSKPTALSPHALKAVVLLPVARRVTPISQPILLVILIFSKTMATAFDVVVLNPLTPLLAEEETQALLLLPPVVYNASFPAIHFLISNTATSMKYSLFMRPPSTFQSVLPSKIESSANSVHNISVIATTEKSPSFFEESLPDNSVVTRSECIMRSANNHLAPSTSFSDLVQYFHFLGESSAYAESNFMSYTWASSNIAVAMGCSAVAFALFLVLRQRFVSRASYAPLSTLNANPMQGAPL